MRITIDIPDELLEEAQRVGIWETPQEAVLGSVEYLVTYGESHQFTERMGPLNFDLMREMFGKSRGDDEQQSGTPEDEHGGESGADDS